MFTIGKLAAKIGIKTDTIRYYETIGLIKLPERGINNYRQYNIEDLRKLQLIRQAKRAGFSLKEIEELLWIKENSQNVCNEIQARIYSKVDLIDQKIIELHNIKRTLKTLVINCNNQQKSGRNCPALEIFENGI